MGQQTQGLCFWGSTKTITMAAGAVHHGCLRGKAALEYLFCQGTLLHDFHLLETKEQDQNTYKLLNDSVWWPGDLFCVDKVHVVFSNLEVSQICSLQDLVLDCRQWRLYKLTRKLKHLYSTFSKILKAHIHTKVNRVLNNVRTRTQSCLTSLETGKGLGISPSSVTSYEAVMELMDHLDELWTT